jgi:hypothetical protein
MQGLEIRDFPITEFTENSSSPYISVIGTHPKFGIYSLFPVESFFVACHTVFNHPSV